MELAWTDEEMEHARVSFNEADIERLARQDLQRRMKQMAKDLEKRGLSAESRSELLPMCRTCILSGKVAGWKDSCSKGFHTLRHMLLPPSLMARRPPSPRPPHGLPAPPSQIAA